LVSKTYSPDDPTFQDYWRQRNTRLRATADRHGRLAPRQRGLCPGRHQAFENGEALHIHHVVPKQWGGTGDPANLRLVHANGHRQLQRPLGVRRWREPCTW
jgi:RNA-directed DNA polymerase